MGVNVLDGLYGKLFREYRRIFTSGRRVQIHLSSEITTPYSTKSVIRGLNYTIDIWIKKSIF